MNIKMTFKHLETSPGVEEIASRKSERLKKYFNGKIGLDWNFSVEKGEHIAHCHLTGNNLDYFAEAKTDSIYSGIDHVVQKLETQLKRKKEKVKDRRYVA